MNLASCSLPNSTLVHHFHSSQVLPQEKSEPDFLPQEKSEPKYDNQSDVWRGQDKDVVTNQQKVLLFSTWALILGSLSIYEIKKNFLNWWINLFEKAKIDARWASTILSIKHFIF